MSLRPHRRIALAVVLFGAQRFGEAVRGAAGFERLRLTGAEGLKDFIRAELHLPAR